jgi:hypothetical protein
VSLDSRSTIDDVRAAYADNASYGEDGSVAKARAFVTACRLLIQMQPAAASKGGDSLSLDLRLLAEQMLEAQRFISHYNLTVAPPRCFSIENFRD